jgi:hypothetical protein
MLEMRIGISMSFAIEMISLDHRINAGFNSKLELASIMVGLVATLVTKGVKNSRMVLAMFVKEGMIGMKRIKKETKDKIKRDKLE